MKPKDLWASFPCSPFCAWIRLAVLRNCDMTLRLKEGRLHLGFSLELVEMQRREGRHGHLENPLTSSAWNEPQAVKVLSPSDWLRARLDQCQTGLSSPSGGLHLKPTLIRTTDELMQHTLSLTCPRVHPHDPVEGSATSQSAMYSPHLADLIASVVLHPSRVPATMAKVGGGWSRFFALSQSGGHVRGEFLARMWPPIKEPPMVRRAERHGAEGSPSGKARA